MGLFDVFKKKDENETKAEEASKDFTVSFGNEMPVPFNDSKYRSIFIFYTGEVVLSAKDPNVDVQSLENVLKDTIAEAVNMSLFQKSFSYADYETQTEAIGEDVAAALKDYDIKSFKLLSFEPDENSKMRIQRMSGAMSTPVEKPELTAEQIREANEMAMAMLKAAQSDK